MSAAPARSVIAADDGGRLQVFSLAPGGPPGGRTVLLVHGSGCGWEYWDAPPPATSIMRYLAERGHAVFAVQSRGYADSADADGRTVNAGSIARDLVTVCAAVAPGERVCLAGHSSGGYPVMMFAAEQAGLTARIAVLGMPYRAVGPAFAGYLSQVLSSLGESGDGYLANAHHREIEKRLGAADAGVIDWYKALIERRYARMPSGVLADIRKLSEVAQPAEVRAPTLVLQGECDYVLAAGDSAALYEALPVADKALAMIPGSYHLPFLETEGSARVAALLDGWFRLPSAAPIYHAGSHQ